MTLLPFVAVYIFGGLTFFPLALLLYRAFLLLTKLLCYPSPVLSNRRVNSKHESNISSGRFHRTGRLRVTIDEQCILNGPSLSGMVKSYLSGKKYKDDTSPDTPYFAVLKYSTLFLYESEQQLDCKDVIMVNQYVVHVHPTGLQDHELFSKAHYIKLQRKITNDSFEKGCNPPNTYYINCNRCVDKEDWYFSLLQASLLKDGGNDDLGERSLHDSTRFDQEAMNMFLSTIHSNEHHFQTQWFNAMLGRVFFGLYKTDTIQLFFRQKVVTKIKKLNAKRPSFLGEITVRSVDPGGAIPVITQPQLRRLSPAGELLTDVHIQYDGGFRFEIETKLNWRYSEKLPPFTIDLVLAITLQFLRGKLQIKIKEPPTNRAWLGFYENPVTEWIVEPVVWEKRIGYTVVSRAIQSKLQELINDTMVLPNMDDIVFFKTGGAGRIFNNATRNENTSKPMVNGEERNCQKHSATQQRSCALGNVDQLSKSSVRSLPGLYTTQPDITKQCDYPPSSNSMMSRRSTRGKKDAQMIPTKRKWFGRKSVKQHRASDDELLRKLAVFKALQDSPSSSLLDTGTTYTIKTAIKGQQQVTRSNSRSPHENLLLADTNVIKEITIGDWKSMAAEDTYISPSQKFNDTLKYPPKLPSSDALDIIGVDENDQKNRCGLIAKCHDQPLLLEGPGERYDCEDSAQQAPNPDSQLINAYTPLICTNGETEEQKARSSESLRRLRSKSLPSTSVSEVNATANECLKDM